MSTIPGQYLEPDDSPERVDQIRSNAADGAYTDYTAIRDLLAHVARQKQAIKHLTNLVEEAETREKRAESRSISAQILYQASTQELLVLRGAAKAVVAVTAELHGVLDAGTSTPKE